MKQLRDGGMADVLSLRNRTSRALGRGEISLARHNEMWSHLDALENLIGGEEEECHHPESNQSADSASEPG